MEYENENCESPIEDIFAYEFCKYKSEGVCLKEQFECSTASGNFRVDFIIDYLGRKIGLECDGKEFHSYLRDKDRDEAIVKENHLDVIYRFRGTDIFNRPHECFKILLGFESKLFTEKGAINIKQLSDQSRHHEYVVRNNYISRRIEVFDEDEEDNLSIREVVVTFTGIPAQKFQIRDEFNDDLDIAIS